MATKAGVQIYGPTSGVFAGWTGLVACAAVFGVNLFDSADNHSFRWLAGSLTVAVIIWTAMLRPRIIVRAPATLELRNPFSAWLVPLASIEVVQVRAITRIEAEGGPYDCVAVGRRIRKMARGAARHGLGADFGPRQSVLGTGFVPRKPGRIDASTPEGIADLMTEQLLAAADAARRSGEPAGPAKRAWAVPELVLLGVLLVALVISFL